MSEPSKRRPTLLIIDDDRAIRRLLARIAERSGFDVETARDGMQAIEMMELKPYDIAIVDLMMPRLSGYELLQRISMLTPRPVVLVATALMNGDVAHLDDSMVRRLIRKPFDINAVANALIETAREIADRPAPAVVPEEPRLITSESRVEIPKEDAPETPVEPKPLPPRTKIE